MKITVTKIVSMTSNVEATVNELSINANVRVRNNDTIEGVDSGSVNNSTGNQLASFSYYGSNNLNVNRCKALLVSVIKKLTINNHNEQL